MIHLPLSLAAWNSPDFERVLKRELEQVESGRLPLQQGLSVTSYAMDGAFEVMVIGATERDGHILARIGVFYSGITAGCNCADDPTPVEPQAEYCELMIEIDASSARASVHLAPE